MSTWGPLTAKASAAAGVAPFQGLSDGPETGVDLSIPFLLYAAPGVDVDLMNLQGQGGSVRHEACRLSTTITKWPSLDLLELPIISLSPYSTPSHTYPPTDVVFIMVALWNRADHYIFML